MKKRRNFKHKQSTSIHSKERTLSPRYIQNQKHKKFTVIYLMIFFTYNIVYVEFQQMTYDYYLLLLKVLFAVVK